VVLTEINRIEAITHVKRPKLKLLVDKMTEPSFMHTPSSTVNRTYRPIAE